MRDVLNIRGGSILANKHQNLGSKIKDFKIVLNSTKIPEIDQYQRQFTENSKMIINNMFSEHTARRYLQGSRQINPTYLAPIASTQIKTTAVIGWTFLGVGLISCTIFGGLYLFQRAQCQRWKNQQNQNDEIMTFINNF